MTVLIPRYPTGTEIPVDRAARALLTADQFDDWLPDPVYYQDQLNEDGRLVSRFRTVWDSGSLPRPEAEVIALSRTGGASVPALAFPLDARLCAHVVITLMAPRVSPALLRDKVYGFRFLASGPRLFDPPGAELGHVFDLVGDAALAGGTSGEFELLDIVGFSRNAKPDRLSTILEKCGARSDECNFLRNLAALGGAGLPSVDDAFAFVYNFYLRPVDGALLEQRHNFFRYRDEYFVFDKRAERTVSDQVHALGMEVRPIGNGTIDKRAAEIRRQLTPSTPTVEETLVTLPQGMLTAVYTCPSPADEGCTDTAEVVFMVNSPPLTALFDLPAKPGPLDALQVLPQLRELNRKRSEGVLLAPPFEGDTTKVAEYRSQLAKGRHWLAQVLETALRASSSWQAGWSATLLSDIGVLNESEVNLLIRVLHSANLTPATKVQVRMALARSSDIAAARFWAGPAPKTAYQRRAMLVAGRHLARRAPAEWNVLRQSVGIHEPELVRHLEANIRVTP